MAQTAILAALLHSARALVAPRAAVRPASARGAWAYDLETLERPLATERDACGVGFVAESSAGPRRRVMDAALAACDANEHRGACSADGISGDGAGIMTAIPWPVYEADTPDLTARRAASPDEVLGCATIFLPVDPAAKARAAP